MMYVLLYFRTRVSSVHPFFLITMVYCFNPVENKTLPDTLSKIICHNNISLFSLSLLFFFLQPVVFSREYCVQSNRRDICYTEYQKYKVITSTGTHAYAPTSYQSNYELTCTTSAIKGFLADGLVVFTFLAFFYSIHRHHHVIFVTD